MIADKGNAPVLHVNHGLQLVRGAVARALALEAVVGLLVARVELTPVVDQMDYNHQRRRNQSVCSLRTVGEGHGDIVTTSHVRAQWVRTRTTSCYRISHKTRTAGERSKSEIPDTRGSCVGREPSKVRYPCERSLRNVFYDTHENSLRISGHTHRREIFGVVTGTSNVLKGLH